MLEHLAQLLTTLYFIGAGITLIVQVLLDQRTVRCDCGWMVCRALCWPVWLLAMLALAVFGAIAQWSHGG
jgi:Kef-type K+ transport system membrane component KefB